MCCSAKKGMVKVANVAYKLVMGNSSRTSGLDAVETMQEVENT